MDSCSKKPNLKGEDDRLSSLPDEILIHILSFLLTRDAFRTSILSTRWEKLWASVPNLSFCSIDGQTRDLSLKYMNFIDKMLLLHNWNIHQFGLNCTPGIDKSRVHAWISTVVERSVRNITISDYYSQNMQLRKSLFTCKTLEMLKLYLYLQLNVPSAVSFSCLKVLHISLDSPSKDLTEKLFCSSPMLEELELEVKNDSGRSKYNIFSTALKKLFIILNAYKLIKNYDSEVIVDAPALEFMYVQVGCFMHYSLKNMPSLSEVHVDVDVKCHLDENFVRADRLCMLLRAISSAKNVSLGPCTVSALGCDVEIEWPVFANVTHLQLNAPDVLEDNYFSKWPEFPTVTYLLLNAEDFGYKSFSDFLALVPNLTSVVFERVPFLRHPDEFDHFEERGVPNCLLYCLKKIEVRKVEELLSELKLVKYLLERAQVLETLTVDNCEVRTSREV